MIRRRKHYEIREKEEFIRKLIYWLPQNNHFSFFNGNGFNIPYSSFTTFAAIGERSSISSFKVNPFEELKKFRDSAGDWLIGRLGYDLKNHIEDLQSNNPDPLCSPDLFFFIPETLIFFDDTGIEIHSYIDPEEIFNHINEKTSKTGIRDVMITCDTSKEEYVKNVKNIKEQIIDGDFYEMNYCIQFYGENTILDPADYYYNLNKVSPMPFSVFQRIEDQFIMSASPERFLKKQDQLLIAQPIKGTIRRDKEYSKDSQLRRELHDSEKERAENMMIVDLMRNDLSRCAKPGSVKVPEIFEVYTFNQLHQMISTVTAELKEEVHIIDAIRNAYPMGSMTGAPKIRVMAEIDRYENSRRGLFSGAAGYITPQGDFDFNVLIRSLFYDKKNKKMKFGVGSAITYDSDPLYEYKECLLKAEAIRQILEEGNA